MTRLNLSDIVALAKSGYSVSDVKELISLSSSEDAHQEQDEPKGEKEEELQKKEKEPSKVSEPQKPTEEPADADVIDEYITKIEELENKISNLQKENVGKDNSDRKPDKSDEEILDDITRSFM